MGASALAADVGSVCVPLAVGAAMGSGCSTTHQRCGGRICSVNAQGAPQAICSKVGACYPLSDDPRLMVVGKIHSAQVLSGIVGVFADNEAVVGVRARTLPYAQAIGQQKLSPEASPLGGFSFLGSFGSGACALSSPDSRKDRRSKILDLSQLGAFNAPKANESHLVDVLGAEPAHDCYAFQDFPFALPDLMLQDEVVIAFGTRTVLRLPLLGANAPLDFNVLGTARLPLHQLLKASQPVEVLVPIRLPGDSLPQVAHVCLSFDAALSSSRSLAHRHASLAAPHENARQLIEAVEVKYALPQSSSSDIFAPWRQSQAPEDEPDSLADRPMNTHVVSPYKL